MTPDDDFQAAVGKADVVKLAYAATTLRKHVDDRWVEVSSDLLSQVLSASRPSHPLQAQSPQGQFQISEQVLTMTLQRALDIVQHCEVTDIRISADGDRYAGVAIIVTAEYPHPLIPLADQLRNVAATELQRVLGLGAPDVSVSAMHVRVDDISTVNPKIG